MATKFQKPDGAWAIKLSDEEALEMHLQENPDGSPVLPLRADQLERLKGRLREKMNELNNRLR